MTLYLSKALNKDHIESIKTTFGFTNHQIIEKFIMDFEMQYQIAQELDCVTRGGLCVPFHLKDHTARRLSEDIDLVTPVSLDETKKAIEKLRGKLTDLNITDVIPKDPKPLPLLSYRVHYRSCYGRDASIKVDILCDTSVKPQEIKTIKAGFSVFAFDTPGDIAVLDHGSLIGDKLSTLSLNTKIGLDVKEDENGITKQLYDIGTLLKLVEQNKVMQSFDTFLSYTNLKIQRIVPSLPLNSVITDIGNSLGEFLQTDKQLSLEKTHSKRFDSFKGNYLGKTAYTTQNHIVDILLIQLFQKSISMVHGNASLRDTVAGTFARQVRELNQIRSTEDGDERAKIKDDLIASIPKSSVISQRVLKGAAPEHIFLLKEILN